MLVHRDGGELFVLPTVRVHSLTLVQGRDVDLLFGLDMLKAHQACIDLEKGVLRIQGREVKFLAEHELPKKFREAPFGPELADSNPPQTAPQNAGPSSTSFPGGGNTLGSTPAGTSAPTRQAPSRFSEHDITTIMNLGATREMAIQLLEAAGGNVDAAASLLF